MPSLSWSPGTDPARPAGTRTPIISITTATTLSSRAARVLASSDPRIHWIYRHLPRATAGFLDRGDCQNFSLRGRTECPTERQRPLGSVDPTPATRRGAGAPRTDRFRSSSAPTWAARRTPWSRTRPARARAAAPSGEVVARHVAAELVDGFVQRRGRDLAQLGQRGDVGVDRPVEVGSELVGIRDVHLRDRVGTAVELIEPRARLVVVDRLRRQSPPPPPPPPLQAPRIAVTATRAREGPRASDRGGPHPGNGSDGSPGGGERWCATMPVLQWRRAPIV